MLYVLILVGIFGAVSLVTTLLNTNSDYVYSEDVLDEESVPVIETDGGISGIIKPYTSESVSISKNFYDINGDEETQKNSLIYYENTYMKNTGVLYEGKEVFDVLTVLDGTVLNVYQDETLGNVVEIEHNTNLRTIYYALGEVNVSVGDVLNQGEILGTSGETKISESKYNLLIEVYYNGALINPEEFYNMDPATLN